MGDKAIPGGEEDKPVTTYRVDYTRKDRWDKFQSIGIGAICSGITIALLGYFGSGYFNKKQARETDFRLYSEIMNQREQADNELRSDMFQKIFDSFLPKSENQGDNSNSIQAIKNDILSLELLTRNFHESIDIKPLFRFILFKIIPLKRNSIKTWKKKRMILNERLGNDCKSNKLLNDFFHPSNDHIDNLKRAKRRKICKDLKQIKKIDCLENSKTDVGELITLLEDYGGIDSTYNELFKVAGRIRRKQVEVLREMGQHLTIKVPMKDVCTDITPRDTIVFCEGKWPIIKQKTLKIGDASNGGEFKRKFTVTVNRAYPGWKQVRVRVEAKKIGEDVRTDMLKSVKREVSKFNNIEDMNKWFAELGLDETPASDVKYSVVLMKKGDTKREMMIDGKADIFQSSNRYIPEKEMEDMRTRFEDLELDKPLESNIEYSVVLMREGDTKRKMMSVSKHNISKSAVINLPETGFNKMEEIRTWFAELGLDETPASDVKYSVVLMKKGDTKREMMKDGKTDIFQSANLYIPEKEMDDMRTRFEDLKLDNPLESDIEYSVVLMREGDTKRKMMSVSEHDISKSAVINLPETGFNKMKEIRTWFTRLGLDETPRSDVIDPDTKEILMQHGDTKREMMKDGKTDIFGNGHNKWMDIKDIDTDGAGNDDQEFWVGAFDFPLVDSTYLSEKERFSVVIEEIDEDSAKLILVYFPSKYTGLKEKSFYHQRVLNHLEKSEIFNE